MYIDTVMLYIPFDRQTAPKTTLYICIHMYIMYIHIHIMYYVYICIYIYIYIQGERYVHNLYIHRIVCV